MAWKDWSYAKKGAVIGGVVSILNAFIAFCYYLINFYIPPSLVDTPLSYFYIFLIPFLFLARLNYSHGEVGMGFFGIFLFPFLWILIGLFLGWIYGKIKNSL